MPRCSCPLRARACAGTRSATKTRCPLCACQEHKPRLPTADGHGAPAADSPGTGEPGRRPQPELPGAVLVLALRSSAPLPEPVTVSAPRQRPLAPDVGGARPWGCPGRTPLPCGRRPYPAPAIPPSPGIRPGCGRPHPSLPGTSTYGACCRRPRRVPPRPEMPSGLTPRTPAAAGTASRPRIAPVPRTPGRQPACSGRPRHRRLRHRRRLPAGCTERNGIGIGGTGRADGARAIGLDHWSSEPGAAPAVRDRSAPGRMPLLGRRATRF